MLRLLFCIRNVDKFFLWEYNVCIIKRIEELKMCENINFEVSERMSKIKGSAIREIFKVAGDPSFISLAGGNPAPELFPNKELAEIASELLKDNPVLSLQYGVTEGYMPLRETIMDMLKRKENIDLTTDEIIVTSGGQQGIELITKCLINEGDTVIVEEPSFIGALNAFRSYNANLVGVPVLEDGMDIEKLEEAIENNKNVKMLYVIPTFQNPSGNTMSLEKRRAVYEICKKNNILIIEDNPYGELTFDGSRVPTIKSMDTCGIVAYSGSFSKIIAPGLRVGFLAAPKEVIAKVVVAKQVSDVHTSILPQLLVYEFIKRYNLDEYIQKNRELYAHKCKVMVDAIDKYFPNQVTHTNPKGGLFVWCDMNGDYDTSEVAKECTKHKVVFVPGSTFMVDMEKPCSCFRLNFSTMTDERIVEGIKILGNALGEIIK